MRDSAGLSLGIVIAAVAWLGLVTRLALRQHPIPWFSLAYNIPITVVFGGLVLHLAYAAILLGRNRFLAAYTPLGLVWAVGGLVLFLRLGTKSIDVSGHMAWSVMMSVQCVAQRLPAWFTGAAWAVVAQVLLLKLFLLGGHSGQMGLAAGIILGGAVWVATRGRKDVQYGVRS